MMTIIFNAQSKILIDDPRLKPKPAGDLLPAWKTSIAGRLEKGLEQGGTVRSCPAIHDYLHLGYIIPLWTDVLVERVSVGVNGQPVRDPKGTKLSWRTAHAAFPLEHHGVDQVKGVTPLEPPEGMPLIIKPICPWLIETPPGWSILVLPFSLHDKDQTLPLEPVSGVVNTDHWHQVHAPCRWQSNEASVKMKAGTPFMHIIPFRRDEALAAEFKLIDEDARLANLAGVLNDFSGGYRKQQKVYDAKRREDLKED